jgi:hypothetical protein
MSMSNRSLKLVLHAIDPRCHWCERVTVLTNLKSILGQPDPLMATIDHLVSKYKVSRWKKNYAKEPRKVLACYECNHKRSRRETDSLTRAEIVKRSKGYSLSPAKRKRRQKILSAAEHEP